MCSLHSNATADEQFEALRKSGDSKWAAKLARLAAEDTVARGAGLELLLDVVKHWPEELQHVRKMRCGRHRAYVTGTHADCNFFVFYVKVNKKSDVDPEGDKTFQRRLLKALADPAPQCAVAETVIDVTAVLEELPEPDAAPAANPVS